ELLCYLYPSKFDDQEEKTAAILLHKICFASLTDIEKKESIKNVILNEEEQLIVKKNNWCNSENLEVKARCNDLLSRFDKDKRIKKITASESYLKAFKKRYHPIFCVNVKLQDLRVLYLNPVFKYSYKL